eukprot:6181721-Pleurochrysis_carterae.AAC.1
MRARVRMHAAGARARAHGSAAGAKRPRLLRANVPQLDGAVRRARGDAGAVWMELAAANQRRVVVERVNARLKRGAAQDD